MVDEKKPTKADAQHGTGLKHRATAYTCPRCGSKGPFEAKLVAWVKLAIEDAAIGPVTEIDNGLSSAAPMFCCACRHSGTVYTFKNSFVRILLHTEDYKFLMEALALDAKSAGTTPELRKRYEQLRHVIDTQ